MKKSKFEQILSVFGSGRSPKSLRYAPWVPLVKGLEITFGFDPGLDIQLFADRKYMAYKASHLYSPLTSKMVRQRKHMRKK